MMQDTATGQCAIAVGMRVYGEGGTPRGSVAAANARFITIAQGADDTERFDLPVAFAGRMYPGRVEANPAVASPEMGSYRYGSPRDTSAACTSITAICSTTGETRTLRRSHPSGGRILTDRGMPWAPASPCTASRPVASPASQAPLASLGSRA